MYYETKSFFKLSFSSIFRKKVQYMDINHEESVTILNEKNKYEKMKDNLRSENEKYKIMRLSSVKLKT